MSEITKKIVGILDVMPSCLIYVITLWQKVEKYLGRETYEKYFRLKVDVLGC